MASYVALFRGINVGKAKRIAMAELRALLEKLGYREVATLLNSGNALFTGDSEPAHKHAERIHAAVAKQLGVEALVIVKSQKEITAIIGANSLGKTCADHSRLLVAVTQDSRALRVLKPLATDDWGKERVHLGKEAAYVWCADGILESRALEALMKTLAGAGTTRNWATLGKIHALMTDGR